MGQAIASSSFIERRLAGPNPARIAVVTAKFYPLLTIKPVVYKDKESYDQLLLKR